MVIRTMIRRFKKHKQRRVEAATCIQRYWGGHQVRRRYYWQRSVIVMVQNSWRARRYLCQLRREAWAMNVVRRRLDTISAVRFLRLQRISAIVIQRHVRGYLTRIMFEEMMEEKAREEAMAKAFAERAAHEAGKWRSSIRYLVSIVLRLILYSRPRYVAKDTAISSSCTPTRPQADGAHPSQQ